MFKNCVFKVSVDTRKWVKAAGVRAIRTTAQTALALIPAGVTIGAVDWKVVLSTSILAGAVSLLTSVAGMTDIFMIPMQLVCAWISWKTASG